MTGYGRGESSIEGTRFIVELQSVNRKQSDIAISLPRSLQCLESRIRELLQSKISRGRLNMSLVIEAPAESIGESAINEELAAAYTAAMHRLKTKLCLAGDVTLEAVLRAPGVLQAASQDTDPETVWPGIESATKNALSELLGMRTTEGVNLSKDLHKRLQQLRDLSSSIKTRAPELAPLYRRNLLERIEAAALHLPIDEDRLLREVLLFADRSDISEELTRLESHFSQFENLLNSPQPVGRTLEFLTQEIGREYNTLGTKSNDAPISKWVVESKVELEKIREQIQNIE